MNEIYDRLHPVTGEVIGRGVRTKCLSPSLTKQSMKAECDINGIMRKYEKTGIVAHVAQRQAYFADVSEVPDFAAAVSVVEKAREMFMSLPATLRARFDNDPAQYVEFCANPANKAEMIALGILDKEPEPPKPIEVVVTNPVAPKAPEVK